jgi:hypothetical protein
MTPAFRQLLNRYAMSGFERELVLLDLLGDDDWTFSPKEATATFGKNRVFPLQFLGTRSEQTNTWLWSWASQGGGIPPAALEAAKKVRQVGRKRSIGELEVDTLDLDQFDFDAHTLALVATAVAGLPAYYRFPYRGGALFAALGAGTIELPAAKPAVLARVIRDVVSRMSLDARTAVNAYLTDRGAKIAGGRSHLVASWPTGVGLTVDFDAVGNVVSVDGASVVSASAAQPSL